MTHTQTHKHTDREKYIKTYGVFDKHALPLPFPVVFDEVRSGKGLCFVVVFVVPRRIVKVLIFMQVVKVTVFCSHTDTDTDIYTYRHRHRHRHTRRTESHRYVDRDTVRNADTQTQTPTTKQRIFDEIKCMFVREINH